MSTSSASSKSGWKDGDKVVGTGHGAGPTLGVRYGPSVLPKILRGRTVLVWVERSPGGSRWNLTGSSQRVLEGSHTNLQKISRVVLEETRRAPEGPRGTLECSKRIPGGSQRRLREETLNVGGRERGVGGEKERSEKEGGKREESRNSPTLYFEFTGEIVKFT